MFAHSCTAARIGKGLSHSFDPLSGWCIFGCGNREDGRIVTREGRLIEKGPNYTGPELAQLQARSNEIIAARTPARAAR